MATAQSRVGMVKDVLEFLSEYERGVDEYVLNTLEPAALEEIEGAARTGWVEMERLLDIDRALLRYFGEEGFVAFWQAFARRSAQTSLMAPLWNGLMRVFVGPAGIVKLMPRGLQLVARNVGDIHASVDDVEGTLTIDRVAELSDPLLFGRATAASLEGALELVSARGTAVASYEPDSRRLTIRVRWAKMDS